VHLFPLDVFGEADFRGVRFVIEDMAGNIHVCLHGSRFHERLQSEKPPAPGDHGVLPRLSFLTTSDCGNPWTVIDAASSSMLLSASVLRTLPSQARSLLRGMVVLSVIVSSFVLSGPHGGGERGTSCRRPERAAVIGFWGD